MLPLKKLINKERLQTQMHKITIVLVGVLSMVSCQQGNKNGQKERLNATEFSKKINETTEAKIIDVRTPEEFEKGHLVNALNYDWNGNNFDSEISNLDKSKPLFVYCLSGGRSGSAASKMRTEGFKEVYELAGGIIKWRAENLEETTGNKIMPVGYTMEDFQKLTRSDKKVLIDFYADWCEPCLRMKPFLEELAVEQASTLKIIRINADDSQALLKSLNIEGLPELQLYQNGILKLSHNGFMSKEELLKQLE
jgi:rhodanese-related sulfurtransferase